MKERKPLQYRPHIDVNEALMRRVAHHLCWHYDVWLRRHGLGEFYFIIEQRRGGRIHVHNPIEPRFYTLRADGSLTLASEADVIGAHDVTLDQLPRVARDAVMKAHHAYIIPWAYDVPAWARNTSRRLHYWPVRELPAIAEFTVNHCVRGGRAIAPITYDYAYHSDAMAEQNAKTPYSDKTSVLGMLGTET